MLSEIFKIVNNASTISKIRNKTWKSYRKDGDDDYIGGQEITCTKASELEKELGLDCIGNGYYKGVFYLGNEICVKINLCEHTDGVIREVLLYKYIQREKPHLLDLLCPIFAHTKDFVIVPRIIPLSELEDMDRYYYCINTILNLFEKEGITFNDLYNRLDNFGLWNNKVVILDYDSWEFKWRYVVNGMCIREST